MKFINYVREHSLGIIDYNSSFKELTTIGVGGDIRILYYPKDIKSLCLAYKFICENNLRYFIIGNGSNILAKDDKYAGIVICLKKMKHELIKKNDQITVSAFYPTINLAYDLANEGLGDLSFLGGIPGLLGGAIYNNSGAYNDCISNHIISVDYINTNGEIITVNNNMCAFGYRSSIFHYCRGIIISANIRVSRVETIETLQKRKKERQLSQPLEAKSMGSIFKNNPLIPSWMVIDALNLRGFRINDAQVSYKHSNFIINLGNASSSDILDLIRLIETRSKLELGIKLISEITIV